MTLANELEILRNTYGDGAVRAYEAITQHLLNRRDLDAFLSMLGTVFAAYGIEPTGAALKLHTDRARGMIARVQPAKEKLRK